MSVQLEALADEVFSAAAAQNRPGAKAARRPFGEVVWHPDYPDLGFLNGIVDLVAPDWRADELERAVCQTIAQARYFRVLSRDPRTVATLGPKLVAAGFHHEVRLAMIQVFQPPRPSPVVGADSPSLVKEGGGLTILPVQTEKHWDAFTGLIRADTIEHGWTPPMTEQLIALYRWRAANTPHRFYLLLDGDHAVAHVGLFQHGATAYLHALFTHPAARRRGAGSTLTLAMHAEASAVGCERLTLQCAEDGHLPRYYARLGFRAVGEQHSWTGPR